MKKNNLKSLKLNKTAISSFSTLKGGFVKYDMTAEYSRCDEKCDSKGDHCISQDTSF